MQQSNFGTELRRSCQFCLLPPNPLQSYKFQFIKTAESCDHLRITCNSTTSMDIDVMSERWLSVEEIAEYLGVSKDTVYAWINKRSMPAHRIGRLWKFKTVDVDTWVRSGGAAEDESRGGQ